MSENEKPVIMVVDDDPALQRLIVALLERAGFDPVSATSAKEAREILSKDPLPELLLLDIMLPEMSGIEYLQEIRAEERLEHLPVIILSALGNPEQIREGLDKGADRYLTKPYLANNLIRTVNEVLEEGRN